MPEGNSKRLAETANRLYWGTSRPAGQLADELGISRSKFYALIEPMAVERNCESCGGELTFSSRTDREAGRGRCPDCGTMIDVPVVAEPIVPATLTPEAEGGAATFVRRHVAAPERRDLWITAAFGVAIGLLAAAWLRRR